MQRATDHTVLGNFNESGLEHHGVHSRFVRRDGKFFVETDGADGKPATFEIKYTFGVDPLQQYLVEFPDGRIQALPIAWDSRPQAAGGQRWFHLYPDEEIKHDDILHWTKPNQNWNFMCAECHSTGVRKNYDPVTDRFATTWAEINVGCEACHGQGSRHVEWARNQRTWWPLRKQEDTSKGLLVSFDERRSVAWPIDPQNGSAHRSAGVTFSDCHDPHSSKLRVSGEGGCLQCHAANLYADAKHSHHATVVQPPTCSACHMQARTYMVVDSRHDHSFRVPRPDLSFKLGTPNACNERHRDKPPQWAADAVESWFGPNRHSFQTYAAAFRAARTDAVDADALLGVVAADGNVPAVGRATALSELAPYISSRNIALARTGFTDSDPMVRIGALDMLENLPATRIWPLASPLLSDPVRGVRIRAVSLLAAVPTASQPPGDRERFDQATKEFIAAQRFNADRPEARTALGDFLSQRGLTVDAQMEYRAR